ncbi:MAG: glutamate-5-semialdehyde dehydrogenase [Spirochaetes bacterium]|nr:glutamate-5-semialdehyde dehydrogenase [Spirochaetota bacterium]
MKDNEYIESLCLEVRQASRHIARSSTAERNALILAIAKGLRSGTDWLIAENKKDLEAATKEGVSSALYDRLSLTPERINAMAVSLEEIAMLEDPIGRIESMRVRPSGIRVGQMRIPIGVIAVIYEARPNVTTDIAGLAIKSGNGAVLRGGREALNSNSALHDIVKESLKAAGFPESTVTLIRKTDHALVTTLLKMNRYIDLVIPRGGDSLIKMVTAESTIPVIKHDKGICHVFIDGSADEEMANRIVINAKVQRPGVCNAMETLLIHHNYPHKESVVRALGECRVEMRGCGRMVSLFPGVVKEATDEDWDTEFLDLICNIRIVSSIDEAMEHIARHGSSHSDAIVTADYFNAERFLREVDSSAVFVNSSTRFHDGGEFGLGAEVGISTEKLHARGTMGVEGLTTLKYVVYGSGEVR